MTRALNFNAGPAALPAAALEQAQSELLDFRGTGMSVMELSHRSAEYESVHNEAITLLRELLAIPDHFDVLFMQGGASQQFAQVPLNFLADGGSADYVVTGVWGEKALSEATLVGARAGARARVAAATGIGEGKDKGYARVPAPEEADLDPDAAFVHVTSNETIHGVQFARQPGARFPRFGSAPQICDMSSDFLWRAMDVSPFSLVYGGAQKNLGPSGVTIVIADRAFIETGRKDIPAIFQYRTFAANNSLYNTPPTFGIYLVRCVLDWIKRSGGLSQIEAWNRQKAGLLYDVIDRYPALYQCPVEPGSRSVMNVVFRLPDAAVESRFLAEVDQAGMVGLRGHRSVGGIRASCYNAVPVAWVQALADLMDDFARRHG